MLISSDLVQRLGQQEFKPHLETIASSESFVDEIVKAYSDAFRKMEKSNPGNAAKVLSDAPDINAVLAKALELQEPEERVDLEVPQPRM